MNVASICIALGAEIGYVVLYTITNTERIMTDKRAVWGLHEK